MDQAIQHAIEAKKVKCEQCEMVFYSKFNMLRHTKLVHEVTEPKYFKHIRKGKMVVCAVCGKEYTHSQNLKNHYLRKHNRKELVEKQVPLKPFNDTQSRLPLHLREKTDTACFASEALVFKDLKFDKATIMKIKELKFAIPIVYIAAIHGAE